jgi:hypothetical protein
MSSKKTETKKNVKPSDLAREGVNEAIFLMNKVTEHIKKMSRSKK